MHNEAENFGQFKSRLHQSQRWNCLRIESLDCKAESGASPGTPVPDIITRYEKVTIVLLSLNRNYPKIAKTSSLKQNS